ncbi:MAG: hypothetical protein K2H60_14150 [Muribaculaceae bacterium]|nr:hypothetical protein [Muribaculaceae bacterium]
MLILLLVACGIASCSNHKQQEVLNRAESLIESHPDSALTILEGIEKSELDSKEEQAQYALLMSMALDKNYIDTTAFDVLQPAIDYYLKNGNANDKLRTYYYQGRIFQNQGDRDNALNSFIKGIDVSTESNDSLCIARTLVAQGGLYDGFYDFDSYTKCHLKAAKIYKNLSLSWNEFDCLLNALNGAIASGNKIQGDSILYLCNEFKDLDTTHKLTLTRYKLLHALKFGDIQKLRILIERLEDNSNLDTNILLNLALAYNKVGNAVKAKYLLDSITNGYTYDTLKYLAISVPILENMGNYKDALAVYREFSHTMDSINTLRFDQKVQTVEDKHKLELQAQQDARENAKIIWGCIVGIVFLILLVLILFLLFRSNKSQKDLAIERAKTSELENKQLKSDNEMTLQKAKITEFENEKLKSEKDKAIQQTKITKLENESLKSEREKLILENKNLQLERDKKALESENLAHRVEILENESMSLKELIDSQEELPLEVQQAIKVRIEMLNALMAGYITDNEKYEKPYESWIKELTDNTEEFMNSNRLAFQASHPRFIHYFEEHNLTVSEINYVCLYAIGLRGKEVGNYMKKRSHVNISSGIRKKLGIDKHETNIGIYVRKLLKEL